MKEQSEKDRRIKLNEAEEDIVGRHLDRIVHLAAGLSEILKNDRQRWWIDSPLEQPRYPPADFKQPRKATTLAVLGPRGSGKTTCMVDLLEKLEEMETNTNSMNRGARCVRPLAGFHPVERIIDCSLGSQNVPFGLSILMRLRHLLGLHRDPSESPEWSSRGEVVEPRVAAEQKAFRVLREAYMLNLPAAGRVLEGTSSSGAHFAQQASLAAGRALSLPDRVADWLQCAAICCGHDLEGFVLVLDDVDLARDGILDMVYSLLDELHQPRLILLIGADLTKLERRIADSLAGGGLTKLRPNSEKSARRSSEDVRMANDLLYKILPQVNREWLLPWTEEERWSFPPRPAPAYELDSSLGELLSRKDWGPAFRTPALLPEYPRHLENLWFALARPQQMPKDNRSERKSFKDRAEFIAYLAEARGDYGLARQVPMRAPDEWGRTFRWEDEQIASGVWDRLVEAALEGTPLAGFSAESDDLPIPENPASAALWTELLLDLSLTSGQLSSAELLRRYPRMSNLVDQAQIRTDFHRDEMERQLRDSRGSIMAQLAWTRFDVVLDRNGVLPEEFDAWIGLAPLREAAEGQRDFWPTSLAQGLFLRRSAVLDERQRAYDMDGDPDDANAPLPRALRPLIVFVDSLSRAPWRLLSETPRRRSLRTNALLAAGLVRAAYVDALERVFGSLTGRGYVKKAVRREDADVAWLDAIHDRGSAPIVEWSDNTVEGRFHALLKEEVSHRKLTAKDLPRKLATHFDWEFVFAPYNELVRCLNAYTKSRAFYHLKDPDFDEGA